MHGNTQGKGSVLESRIQWEHKAKAVSNRGLAVGAAAARRLDELPQGRAGEPVAEPPRACGFPGIDRNRSESIGIKRECEQ